MSRSRRSAAAGGAPAHHPRQEDWGARTVRFELFIVIVGAALLLAAVALYVALGGGSSNESGQIQKNKYQAVFLNGGATSGSVAYTTYFGHITSLNSRYFILKDVYYLTTNQTSSNGQVNPQLTKLGCQQLHSPYDEMVINRSQVAFWENLQDSGKVVQAIKQFQQQNPNGPNCNASASSSSSSTNAPSSAGTSGTTTQNAGNASTNNSNTSGH
ncbi:MAG TPA: hypothetical protein VFP35_00485 [Candidatus Saccharimonadales bacterium]|nr:hypothetical protein [Candidatus Saccharimonadales bacterium]